ncbi:hypothetical protein L6R49_14775 [Myxococcota bacterium]|nr:hypothetical protein [Myxococcota bacterium]
MRTVRITFTAAIALAGLTACAPTKVEGVWHFYLSLAEGSDCTQDVLHNFNDVVSAPDVEDTGSPWSEESSYTASDAEMFGLIRESGDELVLLLGGGIYEGVKEEGQYKLALERFETSSDADAHASGYGYKATVDARTTTTFAGAISRGSFDGSGSLRSTSKSSWTESDTWLEEVASSIGTSGRIPSYDYLTTEDDFGFMVALYNEYDAANCQSADCTLTVTDTCLTSFQFTADRTDIKPEEFEAIAATSQDNGIF